MDTCYAYNFQHQNQAVALYSRDNLADRGTRIWIRSVAQIARGL